VRQNDHQTEPGEQTERVSSEIEVIKMPVFRYDMIDHDIVENVRVCVRHDQSNSYPINIPDMRTRAVFAQEIEEDRQYLRDLENKVSMLQNELNELKEKSSINKRLLRVEEKVNAIDHRLKLDKILKASYQNP